MAIVTFVNLNKKEKGQSLSVAAIAICLSIAHNYRTLIMSTDFNDNTLEGCFFDVNKNTIANTVFGSKSEESITQSGIDGLQAVFASNRATVDIIKNFTRPILNQRLDLLQSPKTKDYKDFLKTTTYYSQICEFANKAYDYLLVDLSKDTPEEERQKILNQSEIVVVSLSQNMKTIKQFAEVKAKDNFYNKKNVILLIEKYDKGSKYLAKNIGRYLREKSIPFVVPYNILFADKCSEGKIIDYILSIEKLDFNDGKDGYFYNEIKNDTESIDYLRKAFETGAM